MGNPYQHLLDPELYCDNKFVATIVESLLQPEITENSARLLLKHLESVPSLDDIITLLDQVENDTRNLSLKTVFVLYRNREVVCSYSAKFPRNTLEAKQLLSLCKCLTFAHRAHSVFFATDRGDGKIHITGGCIHGCVMKSNDGVQSIGREKKSDDIFGSFFHIQNDDEMKHILSAIRTLSKVTDQPRLSEKDLLINFNVTMEALGHFNYYL